jgi:hypothetical protein
MDKILTATTSPGSDQTSARGSPRWTKSPGENFSDFQNNVSPNAFEQTFLLW